LKNSRYLLDSNVVSDLYNHSAKNHLKILERLSLLKREDVFLSILTIYEFEYAAANSPEARKLVADNEIAAMKDNFKILMLSNNQAKIFGNLKAQYKTHKQINAENIKKHSIDLMIAATALDYDLTIVSADKIYSDVQSLHSDFKLENWTL
jgi:predicted nucleic acid-binding protein